MRIIKDDDVRVFADANGDTLTLLTSVRQRDVEKVSKMESQEAIQALRDIGMSIEDAMEQAKDQTPEDEAAARERIKDGGKSLDVRRARLSAVVQGMCIGGENKARGAILEAYDCMDTESAAWVDAQVGTVWAGAILSDAQREGEGTCAHLSTEQSPS